MEIPGFLGKAEVFFQDKPGKLGEGSGFRGKRGFCPYKPNPEKPGNAGMTVPGVEIPGFHGKAGHANSWKAKKPRTKIQAFLESWKFCIDYYSSSKPSLGILGFHVKLRYVLS